MSSPSAIDAHWQRWCPATPPSRLGSRCKALSCVDADAAVRWRYRGDPRRLTSSSKRARQTASSPVQGVCMVRQRALAWAAVLALIASVTMAPLPAGFAVRVGSALAQEDSAAAAGEPTDLAIAALQCDEAPATVALTSFFSTGAAPTTCAPAAGVKIAVTENGDPVPGSPFTTDSAGTVVVPVGLGSAVEVREDPKSLPAGYEPLSQEANGVPYANPVKLDSAVADAAVLFVNVPGTITTELAQDASADAGEATDLAVVTLQCADAPEAATLT